MQAIRSALVLRGSSLREWARAWAVRQGRDPEATYALARRTITRRLARGLAPRGDGGAAILEALRADLGAHVVPFTPAGGVPASTRRRTAA
jgi:hypothetical protein